MEEKKDKRVKNQEIDENDLDQVAGGAPFTKNPILPGATQNLP